MRRKNIFLYEEIIKLHGGIIMSIVTKVAKMRLFFHANMLDVCNVANQLGILKDDKAEEIMKGHTMKCFDAMDHMGLNVKKFLEESKKES